jgi:hypothetical protein
MISAERKAKLESRAWRYESQVYYVSLARAVSKIRLWQRNLTGVRRALNLHFSKAERSSQSKCGNPRWDECVRSSTAFFDKL